MLNVHSWKSCRCLLKMSVFIFFCLQTEVQFTLPYQVQINSQITIIDCSHTLCLCVRPPPHILNQFFVTWKHSLYVRRRKFLRRLKLKIGVYVNMYHWTLNERVGQIFSLIWSFFSENAFSSYFFYLFWTDSVIFLSISRLFFFSEHICIESSLFSTSLTHFC